MPKQICTSVCSDHSLHRLLTVSLSHYSAFDIFWKDAWRDGPPRPSVHHVTGRIKKKKKKKIDIFWKVVFLCGTLLRRRKSAKFYHDLMQNLFS